MSDCANMNPLSFVVFVATLVAVSSTPIIGDNCHVTSYDAISTAVSQCTTIIFDGFTVPAGKAVDITLKDNTHLTFKNTIKFEHHEWAGPLLQIKGKKVTIDGSGATLDGEGAKYWDGKGGSGTKKPKFFRIKTTGGSTVSNIHLLNCPIQCVSVNSASDTVLNNFNIDVSAGDAGAKGHNTDGFDISSSTGITIQNSVIKNQDDCVAVNQGSNFVFHNLTCSGGHGLSLSVGQSSESGSKNTVSNVVFSDSSVINSRNGIHIKTHTDAGTGSITDVTYKNIKFSGITNYGINVQEDYKDGKSTGDPKGNIPIHNLVLQNVQGSMNGGSSAMPVYILCGSGGCESWNWSGVSISNGHKSNECNYTPSGFKC